eukprot:TRINITY_DN52948_c0_g1_i1.p3 TRINITY_DN52948_c0_g1~~TRINITY_DN52948_c0_g1_i1.p3  ORF type:complete len:134 (+),score=22.32 TRINITY_DN52948_c0_g1_i1:45-446(+)
MSRIWCWCVEMGASSEEVLETSGSRSAQEPRLHESNMDLPLQLTGMRGHESKSVKNSSDSEGSCLEMKLQNPLIQLGVGVSRSQSTASWCFQEGGNAVSMKWASDFGANDSIQSVLATSETSVHGASSVVADW